MATMSRMAPRLRTVLAPAMPFYRALQLWSAAGGLRMSAATSFYGILSLAPLLIALVGVLGWWVDRHLLEQGLVNQVGAVIGEQGARLVQGALSTARDPRQGAGAGLAGLVVLLVGATGVFTELQDTFERLWSNGRPPGPKPAWWHGAAIRVRGVGYILVLGFLLLVSLALSALMSALAGWAGDRAGLEALLRVLNEVVALFVAAGLFFALMRLTGGPKPASRFLLIGAFVGAILFTGGRQLLALYLSTSSTVSAYGAAGSLVVVLMWIYFSSAVLLYGAGFARAVQEAREKPASEEGAPLRGPQRERRHHARRKQDREAPAVARVA
ncbi:MAG TPA: YihY/virulence factor BrkB family protein [Ramlibacter sp.]|uniref:YihY/virulence factor BrkB family protein n=1 Tax=Ramlibacter sp. TaxID=1917967 RepID=UPI002BB8B186|nr:YihY/virulence factor BrkB family protein [Ramlibacter sp.]HVZ42588.1 YihY/virulence factor BrkB family protein [Ramlibacter sp.]